MRTENTELSRDITITPTGKTERFDSGFRTSLEQCEIGQWYWVTEECSYEGQWTRDDGTKIPAGEEVKWLGCVMQIGSNFVELHAPARPGNGGRSTRVHFENFDDELTFEPDADAYVQERIGFFQEKVRHLMGEVQEITRRLGVSKEDKLADQSGPGGNALVVVSGQTDTSAYKQALVLAKETTLPALFKEIEGANEQLAKWMTAPTLPMMAAVKPLKKNIGAIEDRIYTIELYAGLTEDVVQCCDGEPAAMGEKLRVMQRKLYMDEESLLSYTAGGMEFKDIGEFDAFMSVPENRDRILPFPRCLAAFQVRREEKEREDGDLWRAYVNVQLNQLDKHSVIYLRNGEQVWRITCDFQFDDMIIPNRDQFDPSVPMMVKMFANRVDDFMPRQRWESLVEERDRIEAKREQWKKENPDAKHFDNPHSVPYKLEGLRNYEPFDPSNVYFDDALKEIEAEIKKYNRVAIIIQGLFDRSEVLHPHPPVKVWDPESFERSIELIYDAMTLTHADAPDFEAYRAQLNASINADSIVTGQQDYWMRVEAERQNKRNENDWRERRRTNYKRFAPYGNTGPGLVCRMAEWKPRARKAVFRWEREGAWSGDGHPKPCVLDVPAGELLNVSAYQPGDYKRFLADARTRREYLKWAPLMLAAEDYHAGKVKLSQATRTGGDVYISW
jgi:hypothetical protein